ncbi:alpha/beta hydrolase [Brevibacillus sp. M2.1A]|uniref:alpha/beta hydrolase n=1 Tax=Brevibacillus TaxID=55080 RepID=UPI00156B0FCB|nr:MULTISPECIES: alpha/beta hydrolase [Brevibacillus]MCC8437583.1 alpha/beta hydrolase [Brevibacillus sp. M2.1A]UKK99708.1 alpha/beta hydrolase [Brevibacillus brevis]
MALDPQVQSFMAQGGDLNSLTGKEHGEAKAVSKVEDFLVPVKNGEIKVRMYTPNEKDSLPVFVYLHGGGWVAGDIQSVDILCQNIAHDAECIVVSVEYRLAPAYRFPIPLEDCYAATKWVAENSSMLRADKTRIAIGGDSAGGNIAASVAVMAQKFNNLSLAAQVLIYPVVDLTLTFNAQSYRDNAEGYLLTTEGVFWAASTYLRDEIDRYNVIASPSLNDDVKDLPPTLMITAEYDPLRDDGAAYAERLKEAGVPVEYKCYEGMVHGFFWMAGILDKGLQARNQVSNYLKDVFAKK